MSTTCFLSNLSKVQNETPETMRTSLQQGEWVTLIDFKDAYFHIPIQEQSRKYMRFQMQGQSYEFKALPFGLSTAPIEFTVIAKEVRLMDLHNGIRIHQYLEDWLVRARSHQICLQHTEELVQMGQNLGWLVNLEKIRTGSKTGLRLCRLPVRPEKWSGLTNSGPVADTTAKILETSFPTGLSTHRETSSSRPSTHDTFTVASQKQLEGTRVPRKGGWWKAMCFKVNH